ncbi:Hypothetical protein SMAX5B_011240 [Scophthalmus maximus]|uniref:Uncharacterized protein n=1 Tax=Scophthalmus maximus TaxID=52904 RepID=A0A2U9BIJ0_SCOMX|nr:Hypothetical protein SMAX5B_011240 [Scophthalmus maximus]
MTDSAEESPLGAAIQAQGKRLYCHEQLLTQLLGGVQELHGRQDAFQAAIADQLSDLTNQSQQVPASLNPRPPRSLLHHSLQTVGTVD